MMFARLKRKEMKRLMQISIVHFVCVWFIVLMGQSGLYAQVTNPIQATIVNANPNDTQILSALNGGGLTLTLGTGNGLKSGVRDKQIAIFSNGTAAGLLMSEGVLFSTGNASEDLKSRNANRTKGVDLKTTYNDADLMSIFSEAKNDAVVYTFNVKLADYTSALRIAFQFGSEEYPNYVGSQFNDAFGFFVTGPNITGSFNMARIPANQKPISINTINYGRAGVSGSTSYSGLDLTQGGQYINNGHNTNLSGGKIVENQNNGPKPVFIEYNGLTKLITYDLVNLQPGGTYTFKIAIADASDHIYDSGVIIQKVQGTTGADLKIEKTVNNMTPAIGEEVEFTLTGSNLGPYNATNSKVNDLLPNGYEYVSHQASKGTYVPSTGVWSIGSLQAIQETVTLKIRAKIKATGTHTNVATISADDLDPDYGNNTSSVTPEATCIDQIVFIDDFGVSNRNLNSGRVSSTYMPATGYRFGTPHPTSTSYGESAIDNGYYAVVAPGHIKYGWNSADLASYFWTPSLDEAGAVTDMSGTPTGAAMVVNGGNALKTFYERGATLQYGAAYRVSCWIYVVGNPSKIAVDIKDKKTGGIIGTIESATFGPQDEKKWIPLEFYFKLPAQGELTCDIDDVLLSFRNDIAASVKNDFYIDNIGMEKLKTNSECQPNNITTLVCPVRKSVITNPMLPSKARQ